MNKIYLALKSSLCLILIATLVNTQALASFSKESNFDSDETSTVGNPFPCDNSLYQVIAGVLKKFDPTTSSYTVIGSSGMGSYNAAGFNVEDGYIYGIKNISGIKHVIKIDDTGEASDHGEVLNFSGPTYFADIDVNGDWVSFNPSSTPSLSTIDLDVFPLTMQSTSLTNLYSGSIPATADITYNVQTNMFYGMASGNKLVEIDPINFTIDIIADWEGSGSYGAAWSDAEGNSYFSNNTTGYIYIVKFDSNNVPTEFTHVAYGEITSNNDGINCMTALPPFETDCSDNIDNDGDGYIDESDIYCLEVPTFTALENDPFVNDAKNSWGITILDYNDDGYDDVFVPNYEANGTSDLYVNNGNGNFTKNSSSDLTNDLAGSVAASAADYDNDGKIDLSVANNVGNSNFLYRNTISNITNVAQGELASDGGYSHSISFVDYDNDSYVDVFVSDFFESEFNKLYQNNGDGTFTRITEGILVNDALASVGSTWADVNDDGWQDVFVPVKDDSNILYMNNGDRTFSKVLFDDDANSVGSSFADIDNDGDMDLFVANASKQNNFLYVNDGSGNFTLVNDSPVSEGGGDSHGSAFGDYDNDGWIDLFVTNDNDGVKFLFLNDGTGAFNRSLVSPIIAPSGNSFGVANADFNRDGALDLAIANHSFESNFLYLNDGNGNNFISINLSGTNSNSSALGTRIYVIAVVDGNTITQMREVSAQTGGGPGSQNSLTQHFGVSDASTISEIRIEWPSGYIQTLNNIPTNQFLNITEDNGSLISGYIFNDSNNNCIKDPDEFGIANTIVEIQPGSFYTITDDEGYYRAYLKPGSYNIAQELPSNFNNLCQGANFTYPISVTSIGATFEDNNFANSAISQLPDLSVDLGVAALRRGMGNNISLSYGNYGVQAASNVELTLTLDSELNIANSSVPYDSQNNFSYTWNLGTIDINETGYIELENFVANNAILNDLKDISVNINCSENDVDLSNNSNVKTERIVASVDPNDILVSPVGFGPAHMIGKDESLTYKIRFQNVGNAVANKVVVIDSLPPEIDIRTFVQGTCSHSYTLEMLDKNVLKWTFDNIALMDSTSNEAASHGYIQFSISPQLGLTDNTKIENSAHIQFDRNLFIKTNTVFNTIDYDIESVNTDLNQVFIYPNPALDFVNISYYNALELEELRSGTMTSSGQTIPSISIFDLKGGIIYLNDHVDLDETLNVPVSNLAKGIYIVRVINSKGEIYSRKLFKR